MPQPSKNSPRKYQIYLSSTFGDLPKLRQILTRQLAYAGLFYVDVDVNPIASLKMEKRLKQEIDNSDIIVFLVKESLGASLINGMPETQFEFEYARSKGKLMLAYFTDNGIFGSFSSDTTNFKCQVLKTVNYRRILADDYDTAGDIIGDILRLISSEPRLSYWIRSDISRAEIESITDQKSQIDKSVLFVGNLIQQFEHYINLEERHRIVGPLLDIGFRPNFSGQAYRFVVGFTPIGEFNRDELEYEYFIDRFIRYENGIVYDRMLDLSWYMVQNQNFTWTWHGAKNREESLMKLAPHKGLDGPTTWRLPTIEELMTLITYTRGQNAYIDETVFPGKVYWFWSSTLTEDKNYAYYIETQQGRVLKDSVSGTDPHRKGVMLCTNGQVKNAGKIIKTIVPPSIDIESKNLRLANQSKRIYGVYLSELASTLVDQETMLRIQHILTNAGYCLSTYAGLGSRSGFSRDVIRQQMESDDYFVLILDITALTQNDANINRAIDEIQIALELNLPISLLHNLNNQELEKVSQKLNFTLDQVDTLSFIQRSELLVNIIEALNNQRKANPKPGWIQRYFFDVINNGINSINNMIDKIDDNEDVIRAFVDGCGAEELQSSFESLGVITRRPNYGERMRFVSKETPVYRLSTDRDDLPILYVKIPDRFTVVPRDDEYKVVHDRYLRLKWWTTVKKNVSYDDAITYAQDISAQESENWRLPSVNELITLATDLRGERKYMDEKVFLVGRWFWTSTRQGNTVLYVDFNFLREAVGREDISSPLPPIRYKCTLLVTDSDEFPSPVSTIAPGVEKDHLEDTRETSPSFDYSVSEKYDPIWQDVPSAEVDMSDLVEEKRHLYTLLKQRKSNLNKLRVQEAKYGMAVPISLLNEIEDEEKKIVQIEARLQSLEEQP